MAEDLTRACLDECIESGQIDFVDDLANIVPAVMTMALLGFRLADYEVYLETTHAIIYTPNDSPDKQRVLENYVHMMAHAAASITEVRRNPRPGLVNALVETPVLGRRLDDDEIVAVLQLLIAGGFDTTTALTAHSLEWLSQNQSERERLRSCEPGLLDSATEEFLRFYAPAPGDARTVTHDYVCAGQQLAEGDRLWLSWAMANRDPNVFPDPDTIKLDRKHNRHTAFGLGVHRCIGSNVARALFKVMATAVLERMPDFVCDAAGTVHYDTIGVINGMKHLPATFTPRPRRGVGLVDTIAHWQEVVDEQRLAAPIDASDVND